MLSICEDQDVDDAALFRALLGGVPTRCSSPDQAYSPAAWQMLIEAHVPVVEIWDVSSRPIDMLIGFDHAQVGAKVAACFLAKGHDRFATLTARDFRGAYARARLYRGGYAGRWDARARPADAAAQHHRRRARGVASFVAGFSTGVVRWCSAVPIWSRSA